MEPKKMLFIRSLVDAVSKGDVKSFEAFFRIYYSRLLNFSYSFLKCKTAAGDIVTDVFAKIWEKKTELVKIQNLDVYLFIAVKNASLNYLKKFSKMRVDYISEIQASVLSGEELVYYPETEIESKELYKKMGGAIESLPEQCKIIFILVKQEGFKCKEVAEILQISPRTVETQVAIAIKKLQKIMSRYLLVKKQSDV